MKTLCAALVVIVATALAIPAVAAEDIGVVTAVTGAASLSRGATAARPIKFRDNLRWQDVIETGKDASARALLLGKTSLTVRELSRVELREDATADGRKQMMTLLSGKVRAIVERSLMNKGEQVEVRSPNAVAAVRGTDFVVEVIPPPAHARGFGMLAALSGGPIVAQGPPNVTTLVYTLTGVVDVTNGLTQRITAFQGARVVGGGIPERFTFARVDLPNIIRGLNVPPPAPAKVPHMSPATAAQVEQTALTQPLRDAAGTVDKPILQRLVPSGVTEKKVGDDRGVEPRVGGHAGSGPGVPGSATAPGKIQPDAVTVGAPQIIKTGVINNLSGGGVENGGSSGPSKRGEIERALARQRLGRPGNP